MPIGRAIETFLMQKQINNCSIRTVQVYRFWLDRLAAVVSDTATLDSIAMSRFFKALREKGLSASTTHQAFRTLRTFSRAAPKPRAATSAGLKLPRFRGESIFRISSSSHHLPRGDV
jgi:site-specific recombinase XerD